MPVTLSDIKYGPSAYVAENGGSLFFSWRVSLDCLPDPPVVGWILRLRDSSGNVVGTKTGTAPYYGAGTLIEVAWPDPDIPEGGVRPQWQVSAECTDEALVDFCTGITKVKKRRGTGDAGEATCHR